MSNVGVRARSREAPAIVVMATRQPSTASFVFTSTCKQWTKSLQGLANNWTISSTFSCNLTVKRPRYSRFDGNEPPNKIRMVLSHLFSYVAMYCYCTVTEVIHSKAFFNANREKTNPTKRGTKKTEQKCPAVWQLSCATCLMEGCEFVDCCLVAMAILMVNG